MSDVPWGTSRSEATHDIWVMEGGDVGVLAGDHDTIADVHIAVIICGTRGVSWRIDDSAVFRDSNWLSVFALPGIMESVVDVGLVILARPSDG